MALLLQTFGRQALFPRAFHCVVTNTKHCRIFRCEESYPWGAEFTHCFIFARSTSGSRRDARVNIDPNLSTLKVSFICPHRIRSTYPRTDAPAGTQMVDTAVTAVTEYRPDADGTFGPLPG